MRRLGIAGLALFVLGVAGGAAPVFGQTRPAAHASATVRVLHVLGSRVASVKRGDGGVPVLLPTTMPLDTPDFTASSATKGFYRLEIDGAEPCDGANVCLFALFTGQRGGHLYGHKVSLSHGIRGDFADITCGASCSPPAIAWIEHGVLYEIEANVSIEFHPQAPQDQVTADFIAAADQSIDAGPR